MANFSSISTRNIPAATGLLQGLDWNELDCSLKEKLAILQNCVIQVQVFSM